MPASTQANGLVRATAFAIAPTLVLIATGLLTNRVAAGSRLAAVLGLTGFAACCVLQSIAMQMFYKLRAGLLGWVAVLGISVSFVMLLFWGGALIVTGYYAVNPSAPM